MEVQEQIKLAVEFIEQEYKDKLQRQIKKDQKFLVIDFVKLVTFNIELADGLLEQPQEIIKVFEIAIEQFDTLGDVKHFKARFKNISKSTEVSISRLRSKHINKFLSIEGQIKSITPVYPLVVSAKFECPSCGNIINVLQLENKFKEPKSCGCGRKGKFRLLDKELVDAFNMMIEELPEKAETSTLIDIPILAKNDLTKPNIHLRLYNGTRVKVNGYLKEFFYMGRDGSKLNKLSTLLEANYIEILDEDFFDIEITEEDKKKIYEFSARDDIDILDCLAENIFVGITGLQFEKRLLVLQAINGSKIEITDMRTQQVKLARGDIHILMVGDPSTAKTQMVKALRRFVPRSRYISGGSGVTDVGLIGGIGKDELSGQPMIEIGAIPSAHKGLAIIDEMDGIKGEVAKSLNEVMEEQEAHINKIKKGKLKAECPILCCANPKNKRFDPYMTLLENVAMPQDLLSRVDAILIIRDIVDEVRDEKIVDAMFGLSEESVHKLDSDFILKYLHMARSIEPVITTGAYKYIKSEFVKIRKSATQDFNLGGVNYGRDETKNIPITYRDAMSALRIARKLSKVKLKNKVELSEAKEAWELKMYSLRQVAYDPETNQFDSNRLISGKSAGIRDLETQIKHYCRQNEIVAEGNEGGAVEIETMKTDLKKKFNFEEDDFEKAMANIRRAGDGFNPKPHLFKLM